MSICCYWTARNIFLGVRILTVKKSLCFVRKWRKEPVTRFTCVDVQNWFGCQTVAKILLVCCGIGGLSHEIKCEGVASEVAKTNIGSLLSQARLSSVAFLQHFGFAFSVIIRGFILLLKFGPVICFYPFTYFSPGFATLWLHVLLKITESSGPTFIKLGQWASTRRDLFSEEFCVKFSKLHIKAIPHPWDYTKCSLEKAFGEGWEKIFMFESREPIGSGCVAQVYKAYVDSSTFMEPVLSELSKTSVLDSALEAWQISGLKGLFRWFWWRKQKNILEGDHRLLHKDGFYESVVQNSSSGCLSTPLSSKGNHFFPVAIKTVVAGNTFAIEQMDSSLIRSFFAHFESKFCTLWVLLVLHPGLVQQVQMDLFLMKIGSRFIELFPGIRWLSLTEIVEEFEKLMIQQIDLRYEARNLEHFHLNFQDIDYVRFPLPLHPFVTENILVETFEESKPISQYLHTETTMELRRKLAKMVMDMLLKMVFVDNFVHGDLHPGNILVQGAEHFGDHSKDGTAIVDLLDTLILELQPSHSPLQLVLLDAGIVAELQGADLEKFWAVFTAVVLGQGEKVAELILYHSRANQCKDVERFKADMAELVTRARSNTVALGKLQVATLLSSVFKLLMTHQVKLESNFACVIFAIMVLEGLGRSLDPELDLLKAAKPLLINPPNS